MEVNGHHSPIRPNLVAIGTVMETETVATKPIDSNTSTAAVGAVASKASFAHLPNIPLATNRRHRYTAPCASGAHPGPRKVVIDTPHDIKDIPFGYVSCSNSADRRARYEDTDD